MTTNRSSDERERREVARGADAAAQGDDRDDVELEQLEQGLEDNRADGTVACADQPGDRELHIPRTSD